MQVAWVVSGVAAGGVCSGVRVEHRALARRFVHKHTAHDQVLRTM